MLLLRCLVDHKGPLGSLKGPADASLCLKVVAVWKELLLGCHCKMKGLMLTFSNSTLPAMLQAEGATPEAATKTVDGEEEEGRWGLAPVENECC